MTELLYFDYQSTTPPDPRVLSVMQPYCDLHTGNPHSTAHMAGMYAKRAVDRARKQIAAAINADMDDVIFTSGATESNNLALLGLQEHLKDNGKTHLITQVTEHACVLACFTELERQGFRVTYLPVTRDGLVDLEELTGAITEQTGLLSIMAVNNEIGVIQPLADIARLIAGKSVLFHCDAAQAMGRIPLSIKELPVDLLSLSSHKIYGPKGIGALYINPQIKKFLRPLTHGGGQEQGLRSGTLPTPLCVGMGEAVKIAVEDQEKDHEYISYLRDMFLKELNKIGIPYTINGSQKQRIPGNLNVSFQGIKNEDLIEALSTLCISSGSACSTGKTAHSRVIMALGVKPDIIESALRISFGRFTTEAEIIAAVSEISNAIKIIS